MPARKKHTVKKHTLHAHKPRVHGGAVRKGSPEAKAKMAAVRAHKRH